MANNKWYNNIPGLSQVSLPATIERGKAAPLDKYSLFDTYEDAMDFVTTHAAAFTGAFVYVLNDSAEGSTFVGTSGAYIVSKVGAEGQLVKLGTSSVSDDIASDLSDLQDQLNGCDYNEDGATSVGTNVKVSISQVNGKITSVSVDETVLNTAFTTAAANAASDAKSKADSAEANAKTYADGKVNELKQSLSNALQFVGISTTKPTTDGATIDGKESFEKGDVVLYSKDNVTTEYVYVGEAAGNDSTKWEELGDVTRINESIVWNEEA